MLKQSGIVLIIIAFLFVGASCSLSAIAATSSTLSAAPQVQTSYPPCFPMNPSQPFFLYNPDFTRDKIIAQILPDAYDSKKLGAICAMKPPPNVETRINLQRLYDILSWQSFLAINWPVNDQGSPAEHLTDLTVGLPQWITWKERYEVFLTDGLEPAGWGNNIIRSALPPVTPTLATSGTIPDKNTRLLYSVKQANSELPLWDQNGNMVYYEILMNQTAFEYINDNMLYNLQGQIDFASQEESAFFSWGSFNQEGNYPGSVVIKLAWKILDGDDIPSRFYTIPAQVFDPDTGEWTPHTVGLVGMHIAHKAISSVEWVWSTFEQVDNVQVNDMEVLGYAQADWTLKPSFNDPLCPTCPINVLPKPQEGVRKTQVTRVTLIPKAIEALNQQVQELLKTSELLFSTNISPTQDLNSGNIPPDLKLAFEKNNVSLSNPILFVEETGKKWQIEDQNQRYALRVEDNQLNVYQGSVWQYYELINTQYATNPAAEPADLSNGFLAGISNISGGQPTPVYLVNSVIETYDQEQNKEAIVVEDPNNYSTQTILAGQSCMGCHVSARLAISDTLDQAGNKQAVWEDGKGDFSFMLEKAQWMKTLFSLTVTPDITRTLNQKSLPDALRQTFAQEHILGSSDENFSVQPMQSGLNGEPRWLITIGPADAEKEYYASEEADKLKVYILKQ